MHVDDYSTTRAPQIELGDVIAERRFSLDDALGVSRLIQVRLGRPVATNQTGVPQRTEEADAFRCPLQILGFDCDDRIFAPFGEDPFGSLQYAIYLAGEILERETQRLNLINPLEVIRRRAHPEGPHFANAGHSSWIWNFDSQPDLDYGL